MAEYLTIPMKRLPGNDDIPLPAYQTEQAVGMDLHAAVVEPVEILPRKVAAIPCGIAMAIPVGFEGQIRPRSGLALKHSITVANAPGTIDPDYRGEIKVLLVNLGDELFSVARGMRVAQLVIAPVQPWQWAAYPDLPPSERGESGFGFTGV